jgi:glycosyltransferase involved in cell wall biosynthesis
VRLPVVTGAQPATAVRHCVILPFFNRLELVGRCLAKLLAGAPAATRILLVDDGSVPPGHLDPEIRRLAADPRVTLLRHPVNRGVSAARNTAIRWCRRERIELVLMIDSDCEASPDFVQEHLRLHAAHAEAACIGAAVAGSGRGFWALLDKVMTFVHALPYGGLREVKHPYHLGTTNFSAKLARLPARDLLFDERLCTGEDALLIRELRRQRQRILFSPTPLIVHHDRETFRGLLWHHYQYGQHQYFVQFGGDLSPRCFAVPYRIAFALAFVPALPIFALLCSLLNLGPWLRHRPAYALLYPLMYLLWVAKGVAILQSAACPASVLRAPPAAGGAVEALPAAPAGRRPALPGDR